MALFQAMETRNVPTLPSTKVEMIAESKAHAVVGIVSGRVGGVAEANDAPTSSIILERN